jgi:hypothetical protein
MLEGRNVVFPKARVTNVLEPVCDFRLEQLVSWLLCRLDLQRPTG